MRTGKISAAAAISLALAGCATTDDASVTEPVPEQQYLMVEVRDYAPKGFGHYSQQFSDEKKACNFSGTSVTIKDAGGAIVGQVDLTTGWSVAGTCTAAEQVLLSHTSDFYTQEIKQDGSLTIHSPASESRTIPGDRNSPWEVGPWP